VKQRLRHRFRLYTVLQVLLLGVSLTALIFVLLTTDHIAVPAVLGIVVLLQLIGLIHYVQSHVNALEDFFAAVNYEDFTRRFVEDDVDAELKDAFNRILERFQDARAARDMQAGYLDTVIRHVPVPFIAARADGSVSLVNHPARRLTGLPAMKKLQDLAVLDPELPTRLQGIEAGQQRLLQTRLRGIPVELRVAVAEIRMSGKTERLYSIENLSGELSARESSAWRNLIRVLTHEIMNTLTPVTSLAETTVSMLDDPTATDDIRGAITTIGRRSSGLISFVSKYRELLHLPQPNPETIGVRDAFDSITTLLGESLGRIDVEVSVVPDTLAIVADRQLIDQVLLNLVKNSVEALERSESPSIELVGRLEFGRTVLSVSDNGPGIPDDELDQIFIPFFTTKRDGSGIGLSLSRQIMSAHGGEIAVQSTAEGTTVSLVFC
jgi:nitrogen fixation/metabolism regulation signal transduction histidine kinase